MVILIHCCTFLFRILDFSFQLSVLFLEYVTVNLLDLLYLEFSTHSDFLYFLPVSYSSPIKQNWEALVGILLSIFNN